MRDTERIQRTVFTITAKSCIRAGCGIVIFVIASVEVPSRRRRGVHTTYIYEHKIYLYVYAIYGVDIRLVVRRPITHTQQTLAISCVTCATTASFGGADLDLATEG